MRLLGLSMGSTSASVATVLAAFFLGLAGGGLWGARLTRDRTRTLGTLAVLEALIGLAGLASVPLLLQLDAVVGALPFGGGALPTKFVVTMVLLALPTICMGATLPVAAAITIRGPHDLGRRIGGLYSLNTAGAVGGAILAGFVLIPSVGLDGAAYAAAAINALIVVIAWRARGRSDADVASPVTAHEDATPPRSVNGASPEAADGNPHRALALAALAVTGFCAIAAEVGWTKVLSIHTGSTLYGFAAILALFLTGMAAGSWMIRSRLDRLSSPAILLMFGLLVLGATLLASRTTLSSYPAWAAALSGVLPAGWSHKVGDYAMMLALLGPSTLLFGALFPLSLTLACGAARGVGPETGRALALNTMAGIAGSLVAGFVLIPHVGTDGLLVTLGLATVLPAVWLFRRPRRPRTTAALALFIAALVATAALQPPLNLAGLVRSAASHNIGTRNAGPLETVYFEEGLAGVISVIRDKHDMYWLLTNGMAEASINPSDLASRAPTETLLGVLPALLHPDPRTALLIGLGGGTTAGALTAGAFESIRVVELEPAVLRAVSSIMPPGDSWLTDERVEIVFNDARNTLVIEDRRYDTIVSQPSHPWLAGAGNLFTQEFFALANRRLQPDGLFVSWVNLFSMDVTTLKSILRAFSLEFPHGFSLAVNWNMILIGSNGPLRIGTQPATERLATEAMTRRLQHMDIRHTADLLLPFAFSRREALRLTRDVPPNSDTRILSEVRLAALSGQPSGEQDVRAYIKEVRTNDLLPILDPATAAELLLAVGERYAQVEPHRAVSVLRQLEALDPERARVLAERIRR